MAIHPLPRRQESRQPALIGRLDLLAQRRQRGTAQTPEDLDVAPVALTAAGAQLAEHDLAVTLELTQHGARVDAVTGVQLLR